MDNLKKIIESLLFVSDAPLTVDRIVTVLEWDDRKAVREALATLSEEYDTQERAFYLGEVAGGYQLRTRPQYAEWARKLKQTKPPRLSKAAMETLAIVAYKQPVIRTDVEHLRGVDCGGVLRMLLERGIIRVLGRRDLPGRPMVYGTSKRFLEIFDLKDLKNLPTLKDIQELGEVAPGDSAEQEPDLWDAVEGNTEDTVAENTEDPPVDAPVDETPETTSSETISSDETSSEETFPEEPEDSVVDSPQTI